nr:HK97 family phage prohead protease [Govania unica]
MATASLLRSAPEGAFAGYASVFGTLDRGHDIVARGAFRRSLSERGASGVKLLWQHDPNQPVGVIDSLAEDNHGLYMRGRLLLDVARAREALSLMRNRVLDGLSIGYRCVRSDVEPKSGARVLYDVDLWEISLVTFPMQETARITAYKAAVMRGGRS